MRNNFNLRSGKIRAKRAVALIAAAALLSSCGAGAGDSSQASETVPASTETTPAVTSAAETTPKAVEAQAPITGETTAATKKPTEKLKLDTRKDVEIFSKLTIGDLVSSSNAMVTNADASLDTNSLGEHEVSLILELDGDVQQKIVKYNVVDSEKPVLFNFGNNVLQRGNVFDIEDYISYGDNCDRAPTAAYESDLDPYTEGDYEVKATVTDSSGNTAELNFTINVTDNIPVPSVDAGTEMDFSQLKAAFGDKGKCGIDVSEWQKEIDYASVHSAGCDFAIIRAGYRGDNGIVEDEFFTRNVEGARSAGLSVGIYFYSKAMTVEQAREEAKWVIDKLGGKTTELPIAFDWENFEKFQQYGINLNDLNRVYAAFADELSKSGYDCMLYGSSNFLTSFWSSGENAPAKNAKRWEANYLDPTKYEGSSYIWQCSGSGKLNGIEGSVDLNVWFESNVPAADIPNVAPPTPDTADGSDESKAATTDPTDQGQ